MKQTDIRLCSYMYPLWLLSVLPPYLVISVPANVVLDALALFLVIWLMKLENRWQFFKNHFGKLFFFGFLSDFLAGALMNNIGYKTLFPYAAFFVACAFVTMLFVKHGDNKVEAKKGLDAYDVED